VGGTGTYGVGQLVTIGQFTISMDIAAIVALGLVGAAVWWIVRRGRTTPRAPDVGAVSVQWITQHRISRPDRSH
jgi:hypothetical protein